MINNITLKREPVYYTAGFGGMDVERSPLYLQTKRFDGKDNDYTAGIIDKLSQRIASEYKQYRLKTAVIDKLPKQIIIINALEDHIPLAYETRRILDDYIYQNGWDCSTHIVNRRNNLFNLLKSNPRQSMVISQCANPAVYNHKTCLELIKMGVTVIPGTATAAGGEVDNINTAALASAKKTDWQLAAHFRLGSAGIILESIYAKKYNSDNEFAPLTDELLKVFNEEDGLYNLIDKGTNVLISLSKRLEDRKKSGNPLRIQVIFDPIAGCINQVIGDAARGLCLAGNWQDFVNNTTAWFKDSLAYYNLA